MTVVYVKAQAGVFLQQKNPPEFNWSGWVYHLAFGFFSGRANKLSRYFAASGQNRFMYVINEKNKKLLNLI